MVLQQGASEIDQVVLKFADTGKELKNWISYSYNQSFLKPTCEWSFTINDIDNTLTDILVYGVGINIYVNDKIQCTGLIEKITTSISPSGGTLIKIQGRDIMAKVVEGIVNPKLQFPTNTTLELIVKTALKPLEITQIDNSDNLNKNIMTGKNFPPDEEQGFNKKALKELKTHYGEGVFQFIDKLLKRHGFMMWARADGKGVVISSPNYTDAPLYSIKHNAKESNILHGEKVVDITGQPTMLYCKGFSNGDDAAVLTSDIIMINELVGLDPLLSTPTEGVPIQQVQDIIDSYKPQGVKILNIRYALIPKRPSIFQKPFVLGPCFIKDDEAQDSTQLENFIRRTMAKFQVKMTTLDYSVVGHTQNGIPWTVNTMVNIDDDVLDIHEPYWILDRTFTKSYSGGTFTDLKLIKPYTLDISQSGGKGTAPKLKKGK